MPSPLQDAFRALKSPETDLRARKFPVASRCLVQRIKDRAKKRDAAAVKKLIHPRNSDLIIDAMPQEPGDRLHAITCGDFVYGDFLIRLIEKHGLPESMTLATLSMSQKNCEKLAALLTKTPFPVHILLSDYFKNSNGHIFTAIQTLLVEANISGFRLSIARSHAKIALLSYPGKSYVIESSANLRSSNNIEQLTAYQDRELYDFHLQWIEELAVTTSHAA